MKKLGDYKFTEDDICACIYTAFIQLSKLRGSEYISEKIKKVRIEEYQKILLILNGFDELQNKDWLLKCIEEICK